MLGCERIIQSVDNKEFNIKIPAGCQFGTKFGLQQQGLYQMNSNVRGNLIVDVIVKTPTLSEQELNILRNIRSIQ